MKSLFCLVAFVLAASHLLLAQIYDFTAVSPSGHTLYYNMLPGGVSVVHPSHDEHNPWKGFDKPSGVLVVPAEVQHNGNSYTVLAIAECCFLECNDLDSIVLPPTLKSIGRYAIAGCRALRGVVVVPEGVSELGNYAFCCSGMSNVVLPTSLKKIGFSAFQDCDHLSYVVVPDGVSIIGDKAFLHVPSVFYGGNASGAPWGAAVVNGRTTQASLRAYLPAITEQGDAPQGGGQKPPDER